MTRICQVVLTVLVVSAAGASTAHAAESPLAAAYSGMLNLMAEALADPGEKAKKLPPCWLSEERVRDDDSEGFSIGTLSVAEAFRQMRADMRGGTITRSGRMITRVKGAERATLELDAQGRITGGVIEDPDDGRYRMTVTYPDVPFTPVSPTPECTDEQLGDDGDQAA